MYFAYVLYSLRDHKLYKGSTSDVSKRLQRHNSGGNRSTAHRKPFTLIHLEIFETKPEATAKERYWKTAKGTFELKAFLRKQGILGEDNKLAGWSS